MGNITVSKGLTVQCSFLHSVWVLSTVTQVPGAHPGGCMVGHSLDTYPCSLQPPRYLEIIRAAVQLGVLERLRGDPALALHDLMQVPGGSVSHLGFGAKFIL